MVGAESGSLLEVLCREPFVLVTTEQTNQKHRGNKNHDLAQRGL